MVWTDKTYLVADTMDELHDFAKMIGIPRQWFKDDPQYPHYEIFGYKVDKALEHGAIVIRPKEVLILSMQISEIGSKDPALLVTQVDKLLEYDGYNANALPRKLLQQLKEKINEENYKNEKQMPCKMGEA